MVILLLVGFFISTQVNAQLSKFYWAKNMGGTLMDEGNSIALDLNGNVYITGWFQGRARFGEGVRTVYLISAGASDIFVAKLDKSGNLLWVKQMGGDLNDGGYAIAIDANCNVYTAGFFKGTVDFNPNSGAHNLTSVGDYDIFVTKLDSLGNFLWTKRMGGNSIEQLSSLVVDLSGQIYIAGYFRDVADFDPGELVFNMSAAGLDNGYDIFIVKLNESGNFIWAKQMGGTSDDLLHSLKVDIIGNIYSTGSFIGISEFDPGIDTLLLTSVSSRDIFVSKLDSSGNLIWVKQMGGSSRDIAYSIAVDVKGNVYTAGLFSETVDFDPGTNITTLTTIGENDGFICKLDSQGNFIWAKQLGGDSSDAVSSLVLDNSGNIYSMGWFSGSVDFDPGPEVHILESVGQDDIFISKLDSSANFIWSERMGGVLDDFGIDLLVDPSMNIYSIGYFEGVGDF
ncbi:MAG: SBBP repeat-containing protein [Ignavibacteria bacterium]|nr:SBBP repeat-containing protein [Ignavibacteria bacterium]